MKKLLLTGLALLTAAVTNPATAAPSLGDVVTCGALNLECPEDPFVKVGAGAEFGLSFGEFGIILLADFATGSLTLSNANNSDLPDGFELLPETFVQFRGDTVPFTSVSLGATNGVSNFDASKLTLDDDGFLTLDLSGVSFLPNGSLQVQIDQTAAVPEPTTWALMILGFGVVGHALRRRKVAAPRVALA